MPEDPDKGLHRNRVRSIPVDKGARNCYSVRDILTGKTHAAWGSEQSAEVAVTGQQDDNPDTWTKRWYTPGRVLRVPKAVVLSSHPQWTLYWPKCYFYMPRDVINDDGYGQLGNYYYLDQWNGLDLSTVAGPDYGFAGPDASQDSPGYRNNPAWADFKFITDADKTGVYNAKAACGVLGSGGCESVPSYLFNTCTEPPREERFQVQVGEVNNPYYKLHQQYMGAFLGAKAILEGDAKDPILVSIPRWMSQTLPQVRNSFLKRTHESRNSVHGGAVNYRPCDISDATPCHIGTDVCWAPPYPDRNDPAYRLPFLGPDVPWLLNADPGVGTNTLHLYIGHPNVAPGNATNMFDYQAWPLTPEAQWIFGAIYSGNYTGSELPFFAGRRLVWKAFGFDYGYAVHGPEGLWDTHYGGIVTGAAGKYKQNFWKMRDQATRIFTYDANWDFSWYFDQLDKDRRNDCPATQFYSGFDFDAYAAAYDNDDNSITDCSGIDPAHLTFGETTNFFPLKADIDRAKEVGKKLRLRVEAYYRNNDAGSGKFFDLALGHTGLADYNVSYEGPAPGQLASAAGVVEYVREYFANNK